MTRLELLERIATLAVVLRDLETLIVTETNPRQVQDDLTSTRRDLDDALEELRHLGQE